MECAVSVSVSVSAGERCGMQPWVRPVAAPPPNPLASAGFCLPCVCVCMCVLYRCGCVYVWDFHGHCHVPPPPL